MKIRAKFRWQEPLAGLWAVGGLAAMPMAPALADASALPDLKRLSLEELSYLEVSSVSRAPEPVSGAPAAIYVITGEDVRRSGVTSLPEILRQAPNLQVARIAAGDYAISARGFNSQVANKLLVLVDGRTIYTPLYSGVYWDMQAVPTTNIARIEVVSGPGGALWGSNAVNGVINVVTREANADEGALVRLSGGNADLSGTAQVSGALGANGAFRVYGQAARQGHTLTATGTDATDQLKHYQAGARSDWALESGSLTVQGDIYDGVNRSSTVHIDTAGGNALARWRQRLSETSHFEVQGYYDYTSRNIRGGIHDSLKTYDIAAQHGFNLGARHRIVWGGGYRMTKDELIPGTRTVYLVPGSRTLRLSNIFIHDTIAVTDTVKLALGFKAEHNSYTGFEYMPDARLSWQVSRDAVLWAAASRAMRTPSRFDRDLFNTGLLEGGPTFRAEEVLATEAGYRARVMDNASLSVSVFYNVYDHLRTVELPFPMTVQNRMEGDAYGVEAWATVEPLPWWRLKAGAMVMDKNLRLEQGSTSFFGFTAEGNDPSHQFSLRSEMNVTETVELDWALRVVGALPNPRVPAYAALDARLGWNMTEQMQLSLSGYNLTNAVHTEFIVGSPPRRDIRRSFYATARWSF